ncbi:MAG: hypothetical protein GX452_04730 [Ignavibacteriales bacterium]|jgi:hypothetical protein|nr:hypothetical protein [Ignavibacteriales bacterium]
MHKDKYDLVFKAVTIGIPIAAFVIIAFLISAGAAIPLLVLGWFGYLAVRSWGRR